MVKIRLVRSEDIAQVYKIESEAFKYPYPRTLLEYYSNLKDAVFYVAEVDNSIVGYVIGLLRRRIIGHIISIAVSKRYMRRGIGSKLLKKAEETLRRMGAKVLRLEVRNSNIPAINFYVKHGYKIAFIKEYYYPNGESAYVMYKVFF